MIDPFHHAAYSGRTRSKWHHVSRHPHAHVPQHVNELCQGVRRDPLQYHANMFGVTKRDRTVNKISAELFLEYDF
jgi:hypothetical protein